MAQRGLAATEIANLEAALAADGIRTSWLHRWCWQRGWALPPAMLCGFYPAAAILFLVNLAGYAGLNWIDVRLLAPYNIDVVLPAMMLSGAYLGDATREQGSAWYWRLFGAVLAVGMAVFSAGHSIFPMPLTWWLALFLLALALITASRLQSTAKERALGRWPDYWQRAAVVEAF